MSLEETYEKVCKLLNKNYKNIEFKTRLNSNNIRIEARTKIGGFVIEPFLEFDDLEKRFIPYKNNFVFGNIYI